MEMDVVVGLESSETTISQKPFSLAIRARIAALLRRSLGKAPDHKIDALLLILTKWSF